MPCVWYHYRRADSVNWVDWWAEEFEQISLEEDTKRVKESEIYSFVLRHLPANGVVLEGGCGKGGWVKAISEGGLKVLGLDFAFPLVHSIHSSDPTLNAVQGDVAVLPLKDNSLTVYLSFGVVEHFPDGPEKAIMEAWRVLRPNGILLVSVPYYNFVRRFWMPLDRVIQGLKGNATIRELFRRPLRYAVFYQYGFGFSEFKSILQRCGFQVIDHTFYDFRYGLFRDSRWLSRVLSPSLQEILAKFLARIYPALCAHMVLFAAKKVNRYC
ncbi:putative S-adenosylmethionine-dependent methyltransferase [bacterium HR17]|jgi:SAM-dependent methyltransferase|uniref:Putative S-adenosylmethionine-dependent methyltransferase n=1 Tax=Candidatus Fervidibacter japonicus TaxID=2035412 RepID=A0A2H5XFC6_9BACT|nr:putative S-adenosylmethionine-dependent methyltransferase [bacterium HR17]